MINHYRQAMKKCYQIDQVQTVQSHGYMVFKYALDLIGYLKNGKSIYNQKVPQILLDNKEKILQKLIWFKELKHYTMWHDIGKPFCKPDN